MDIIPVKIAAVGGRHIIAQPAEGARVLVRGSIQALKSPTFVRLLAVDGEKDEEPVLLHGDRLIAGNDTLKLEVAAKVPASKALAIEVDAPVALGGSIALEPAQ